MCSVLRCYWLDFFYCEWSCYFGWVCSDCTTQAIWQWLVAHSLSSVKVEKGAKICGRSGLGVLWCLYLACIVEISRSLFKICRDLTVVLQSVQHTLQSGFLRLISLPLSNHHFVFWSYFIISNISLPISSNRSPCVTNSFKISLWPCFTRRI